MEAVVARLAYREGEFVVIAAVQVAVNHRLSVDNITDELAPIDDGEAPLLDGGKVVQDVDGEGLLNGYVVCTRADQIDEFRVGVFRLEYIHQCLHVTEKFLLGHIRAPAARKHYVIVISVLEIGEVIFSLAGSVELAYLCQMSADAVTAQRPVGHRNVHAVRLAYLIEVALVVHTILLVQELLGNLQHRLPEVDEGVTDEDYLLSVEGGRLVEQTAAGGEAGGEHCHKKEKRCRFFHISPTKAFLPLYQKYGTLIFYCYNPFISIRKIDKNLINIAI